METQCERDLKKLMAIVVKIKDRQQYHHARRCHMKGDILDAIDEARAMINRRGDRFINRSDDD